MARVTYEVEKMAGLWRVKHTKALIWPEAIMSQESHPMNGRGDRGYVVDMDQGYEKVLCYGQERFLEKVPKHQLGEARTALEEQDPKGFPRPVVNALVEQKLMKREPMRRPTTKTVMEERTAAQKPTERDGLPGLDQTTRARTRRPKKAEDAVQDDQGAEL